MSKTTTYRISLLVFFLLAGAVVSEQLSARTGRSQGYYMQTVQHDSTLSGEGTASSNLKVVAGSITPSAHVHDGATTGGATLNPDVVTVATTLTVPSVAPGTARGIGVAGGVLQWHDGTAVRTGLYNITNSDGITVTGTGATRTVAADFGTASTQVARGSNTFALTNGNSSFTFGSTAPIGATISYHITPVFGSASKQFTEGNITYGLTNAASSFTFGPNLSAGAGGTIAITPTFSTAANAFAEGDNTVGLRNAASSFLFGTAASIGANASLIDITPTFSSAAGAFVQGNQTFTGTAGGGLTGGVASDALGDGVTVAYAVGAGTGITVNTDDIAVNYGNTSTTAARGDKTVSLRNANSSFTFGSAITIGDGGLQDITPTFGSGGNQFAMGNKSIGLRNASSSFTFGGDVLIGDGGDVDITPTFSTAANAFAQGNNTVGLRNAASSFSFGPAISIGAATSLIDITPTFGVAPATVDLAANAEGSNNSFARSDHKHDLSEAIAPTWTGLHIFNGGAAGNPPLRLGTSANPSSDTLGDLWLDSTQGTLVARGTGSDLYVSTGHFTQTADVNVNTTVTETTLVGSGTGTATLPALILAAGKTVTVSVSGYYSTKGAPAGTLRLRTRLGGISGTIVGDTGAQTLGDSLTNRLWRAKHVITCRSTGPTGTVMAQGESFMHTTAIASAPWEMSNTGTQVINTTSAQALVFSAEFGTSDASNSITATNLSIEILN